MRNILSNLSNEVLDELDILFSEQIKCSDYKKYYTDKSSMEHYRLLAYLSLNLDENILLDVGTLKGSSALALANNIKNKVYSFNIGDELDLYDYPNNIEFIIDNILNGEYDSLIKSSSIILLDTFHDGGFERNFLNHIVGLGFKGILLCDDIYLNQNMIDFWDSITQEKIDLTKFGHWSGTGAVLINI